MVRFLPTLLAVGFDGTLRRYGPNPQRAGRIRTPGGTLPLSVAADPAGQRIAVGYTDTTAVDLFEAVPNDLRHKAANREGTVTPLGLHAFIVDRVKELAEGQQHPTRKPAEGIDFPIALARR